MKPSEVLDSVAAALDGLLSMPMSSSEELATRSELSADLVVLAGGIAMLAFILDQCLHSNAVQNAVDWFYVQTPDRRIAIAVATLASLALGLLYNPNGPVLAAQGYVFTGAAAGRLALIGAGFGLGILLWRRPLEFSLAFAVAFVVAVLLPRDMLLAVQVALLFSTGLTIATVVSKNSGLDGPHFGPLGLAAIAALVVLGGLTEAELPDPRADLQSRMVQLVLDYAFGIGLVVGLIVGGSFVRFRSGMERRT